MSSVKKAFKKVTKAFTGVDLDADRKAEEEARRQSEEAAATQAALSAEQGKVAADAALGAGDADTADVTQAASAKKKKLKEGRKQLSVARSGGAGINV